jgi:hypothetical protein
MYPMVLFKRPSSGVNSFEKHLKIPIIEVERVPLYVRMSFKEKHSGKEEIISLFCCR